MKILITLVLTILFSTVCIAQNGINYKAIIKNNLGNVVANQPITVQFTILKGVAQASVYQENHTPTTNANGLIIINIGEGTPVSGSFAAINWANGTTFLNTKINTGAGFVDMGTTEFKTVPYALNAKSVTGVKINDLLDGKSDANGSSLFIGQNAGVSDDGTDNRNVGIGSGTLYNNNTGIKNTAIGANALFENTIGTYNTATGYLSLYSNLTGVNNVANGNNTLYSNTTGNYNTASGNEALYSNKTGTENVANGSGALYFNTTASANVANGYQAMFSNTTGYSNTANGFKALYSNTTGSSNTANGIQALYSNTTGRFNTSNGYQSLYYNTTGSANVASGSEALKANIIGDHNTATGIGALLRNIGSDNTAIGYLALFGTTTGNNNIGIGYQALVPSATGSNQVRMGNTAVTYAGVQVAWTVTSDRRWKDQIRSLPYGLNMVTQLQPVDYIRKNNEAQTREIGFIAQDVKALLEKLGYTDQGILSTDDDGYMSLRYNDFIPILVKAIQEQQGIINNQNAKLKGQDEKINGLTAELDQLKTLDIRVKQLESVIKPSNQ